MTSAADKKTYWGLGETVTWLCTRDEDRVAAMWDMNEERRIALALFERKAGFDPRSLLIFRGTNSDADREVTAPQSNRGSSCIPKPIIMDPGQALDDLNRKVQSGRVQMTAIRCDRRSAEQIPVPLAELNDLILRISPGHRVRLTGLWSRSFDTLVWILPQFLRADVISVWPPRNTKTAAVSGAILRHLREITTSKAPLSKLEAQQRCLAEVPNAYPEAFKQAWAELDRSRKRGRGQHGSRR